MSDLKASIVRGFVKDREAISLELEAAVEQGLDVRSLVTEKVAGFPLPRLEQLVLEVASRELRHIEVLGGVLGFLVGLIQAAVLTLLV